VSLHAVLHFSSATGIVVAVKFFDIPLRRSSGNMPGNFAFLPLSLSMKNCHRD
jgi:hypothetical protein